MTYWEIQQLTLDMAAYLNERGDPIPLDLAVELMGEGYIVDELTFEWPAEDDDQ